MTQDMPFSIGTHRWIAAWDSLRTPHSLDALGVMYLDHRLPNPLLNWRGYRLARLVPIANPLIDYDILD